LVAAVVALVKLSRLTTFVLPDADRQRTDELGRAAGMADQVKRAAGQSDLAASLSRLTNPAGPAVLSILSAPVLRRRRWCRSPLRTRSG